MDFKIIERVYGTESFVVTIELLDSLERRGYAFPIGEGWEDKENGELKFITNIKQRLSDLEKKTKALDSEKIKKVIDLKGKVFKDKKAKA